MIAKITVAPMLLPGPPGVGGATRDIPFTMVGFTNSDTLEVAGSGKWDPAGRFNGPKEFSRDQLLADYIIASGSGWRRIALPAWSM